MGRLKDKIALISGGGSGLGEAMGRLFAQEGAKVVITDVDEERGNAVVSEIKNDGKDAMFLKHDVTSEEEWESVVKKVIDKYEQLNVVVNNAGVAMLNNVAETSFADWKRETDINLDGVFLGTKHGVLAMKKLKVKGSIINISSILGLVGDSNAAAYAASKGGVKLLTKSAALYCAEHKLNIRVNSIHPGYIDTPMVEGEIASGHATREELDDMHPIGHIGEPMDIAYGALYLASDESKFVTGSELVIDGGYTAK